MRDPDRMRVEVMPVGWGRWSLTMTQPFLERTRSDVTRFAFGTRGRAERVAARWLRRERRRIERRRSESFTVREEWR